MLRAQPKEPSGLSFRAKESVSKYALVRGVIVGARSLHGVRHAVQQVGAVRVEVDPDRNARTALADVDVGRVGTRDEDVVLGVDRDALGTVVVVAAESFSKDVVARAIELRDVDIRSIDPLAKPVEVRSCCAPPAGSRSTWPMKEPTVITFPWESTAIEAP